MSGKNELKEFLTKTIELVNAAEGSDSDELCEVRKRAEYFLAKLENGGAEYNEFRGFWFFWRGSEPVTTCYGSSPEDAFTKCGYGAGALGSVDYYNAIPTGINVATAHIAWPDKESDRRVVLDHFLKELELFFSTADKAAYEAGLFEMDYMIGMLLEKFDTDHFVYAELFAAIKRYDEAFQKL